MDKTNQEQFMGNIRFALGYPIQERRNRENIFVNKPTDETRLILDRIKMRSSAEKQKLFDQLLEAAGPINLDVSLKNDLPEAAAAICDLAKSKSPEWGDVKKIVIWEHPLLARMGLEEILAGQHIESFITDSQAPEPGEHLSGEVRKEIRQKIAASYIGVTSADFCMADTATLVMRNRVGQPRSVAVVPSIHVAVIEQNQIVSDLKEFYALLKWDPDAGREGLTNYMAFISGPSKTADIEATLVHGAHGPREVYVYVVAAQD